MKAQKIQISQAAQRLLVLLAVFALGVVLFVASLSGYEGRYMAEAVANTQMFVGAALSSFSFAAIMR